MGEFHFIKIKDRSSPEDIIKRRKGKAGGGEGMVSLHKITDLYSQYIMNE